MERRDFIKSAALAAGGVVVGGLAAEGMDKISEKDKNTKNRNMKVLLINGSARRNGNTSLALQEVTKSLEKQGIETEIVHIGAKAVRGCIACGQCSAKGLGHCVFDDDICNSMLEKMAGADALVVGSPVYYGIPNGSILSLIQRMCYSGGHLLEGKPAAAVAVCRRGGGTSAFQALQMPFQMMNMPIVTSQYWNIVYGLDEGDAALDAEGLQTMRHLGFNMAKMLKGLDAVKDTPDFNEPWMGTHFVREDLKLREE